MKTVAVAAALAWSAFLAVNPARAALTFYVDPGSPWPAGWYNAAVANMQTTVNMYNAYGDFGNGSIYVYYNAGIPTAQSGYGGSGGSIGDGGTYPNVRVLLHESSHWLGTGTYSAYWTGPYAGALIQQFDGVGAIINGDTQHYWPYGENYDNESSAINDARHIAMVYALREDFGIGSTAAPSAATNVTMTASDAVGTSSFNEPWSWSDAHFAQPGTDYSTGNFTFRTPAGAASFSFVGNSLTVNNSNGISGGLLFKGTGTSGVLAFKNLTLNGGYVRQASSAGDLFQIAGKVTLLASPTIDAAQGNIAISANIVGAGSLTKAGAYALTLTGTSTYGGNTTINAGILRLSPLTPVAGYTFDNISGTTVLNDGSGGASMNGTLANGATIVAGGQSGNAVSLAAGASVDINSPITDLGPAATWTVSAWVKTSIPGSSILTKSSGGWTAGNTILYLGDGTAGGTGGIPSSVRWGGGFYQGSAAATNVANNLWHQVTYVNNAGTYSIFVDGNTQPLSSGNSSFASGDVGSIVRLGITTDTFAGDGTVNFNGLLDNVRIYNQALTSTQVSSLYQGNTSFGTLPSSTNVTVASGASLDLNGATQQIASLAGAAGSAVTLGNGKLTVASAASTTFSGIISGSGGSFAKQGAGSFTLTAPNTYSGPTTISQGTIRLASVPVSVAHRWSFNNSSLADSAGASPATVVDIGANNISFSATQVSLAGGASNASDYISLGAGLLPKNNTPVTIELWATQNAVQNWSRIFDFGSGTGENLFMSWTQGTNLASDRVEWKDAATSTSDNTNQPFTLGTEFHVVMVLNPSGNSTVVTWYVAPTGAASLGAARGTFTSTNTLAAFIDAADNLGYSSYPGDNAASASYDEVRLWNGALNATTLQFLHAAGPDANLGSVNQPFSSGQLPSTTDLNINASGAALDLNGIDQTLASITGVPGSSILLGTAALTVNGSLSTTFAGSISGAGSLVKSGAASLTLSGPTSYTGPTSVNAGTLIFTQSQSTSSALTINAGATVQLAGTNTAIVAPVALAPTAKLDLTTNALIVNAADESDKAAKTTALAALITSARAANTWAGTGITSSTVALDYAATGSQTTTLALIDNADLSLPSFNTVLLNANSLVVTRALLGDADLSGIVDAADFDLWFKHVGFTNHTTSSGDFDLSGVTDALDFDIWFNHVGLSGLPLSPPQLSNKGSALSTPSVPEPTSLLLLAATLPLLTRRRH